MLKEYLKKFRNKNNLTQHEMAEKLKTSQSYYSQIESGYKNPGHSFCRRLAGVLGVSETFVKDLL